MKILIVTPRLCYGGAERVSVLWGNGFARNGHEVIVAANLHQPVTYKLDSSIKTFNLISDKGGSLRRWSGAVCRVRHIIKKERPDVVIGINRTCSLTAWLASRGLHTRVIATEHDSFQRPKEGKLTPVERFFKFRFNRVYDRVTVITQADKDYIGNRLHNVVVMPNPLATAPATAVPAKKATILAVGRVDDYICKGFDVLLHAWGQIASNHPDWTLEIAGKDEGGGKDALNRIIVAERIPRVAFTGYHANMVEQYAKAAIFVLSSRYEGFGLVLIEAMSQGCACVATDYIGRQKEILLDGESNGLTCRPGDADDLAEKLERVISNKELRESMQAHAIERSKEYELPKVMAKWEHLLGTMK